MTIAAAALLAVLPAPALADLRADYKKADGTKPMSVEVADNGAMRADLPEKGAYALSVNGQDYIVTIDGPKPVAMRLEDVTTVMRDEMKKLPPPFRDLFKQMFSDMGLTQKGTRTINGRTGAAYFAKGDSSSTPVLVISTDPTLAPLSKAMQRQFELSFGLMGAVLGVGPNAFKDYRAALASGTPLTFEESDLSTIDTKPIDPKRFALPGAPATLEEVRVEMKRSGIMKKGG